MSNTDNQFDPQILAGWNRLVDPNRRGQWQRFGRSPNEAVCVRLVSGIEHRLAARQDGWGLAEVDHRRGEQTDAGMTVLLVVPMKELLAEGAAVLDAAEANRHVSQIL